MQNLVEPSWNPGRTTLTSGPPRTTPEPIWAETPKLSAVGGKKTTNPLHERWVPAHSRALRRGLLAPAQIGSPRSRAPVPRWRRLSHGGPHPSSGFAGGGGEGGPARSHQTGDAYHFHAPKPTSDHSRKCCEGGAFCLVFAPCEEAGLSFVAWAPKVLCLKIGNLQRGCFPVGFVQYNYQKADTLQKRHPPQITNSCWKRLQAHKSTERNLRDQRCRA